MKDINFKIGARIINMQFFPSVANYYQQQFPALRSSEKEWVGVKCCFHEDRQPSLRINLKTGGFRCFGCGIRGGNIIAFHCQRYQLTFREAVSVLEGK